MHQLLRFVRARQANVFGESCCSFSRCLLVDIDVAREGYKLRVAGDLHCFCRGYPGLNHPRYCCNSPRLIPVSSAVITSGLRCSDVEAIKNLQVAAPNGARIPLSQLSDIRLVEGPTQISREDTRRRIGVELNVRGRDIGSFVQEAQAKIDQQIKLPAGYYLTWGGTFENLQRASQRLLIVVPLALFLVYQQAQRTGADSCGCGSRGRRDPFAAGAHDGPRRQPGFRSHGHRYFSGR